MIKLPLLFSIGSKALFPEKSIVQGRSEDGKAAAFDITVRSSAAQIQEKWLVGVCEGSEKLKDKKFSKLGRRMQAAVAVKMGDSMESSVQPTSGKICTLRMQTLQQLFHWIHQCSQNLRCDPFLAQKGLCTDVPSIEGSCMVASRNCLDRNTGAGDEFTPGPKFFSQATHLFC